MRTTLTWLAYSLCMAMVLIAMSFISMAVLDLEQQQFHAQQAAQVEESVRSALWRMDAAFAPVVARENARPPEHYVPTQTVHVASKDASSEHQYTAVASPLTSYQAEHVLLYFQIDDEGNINSPQTAEESFASAKGGNPYHQRLDRLSAEIGRDKFESAVSGAPALPLYVLRPNAPRYDPAPPSAPENVQADDEVQQTESPQMAQQQLLPLSESVKNRVQARKRVEANLLQQQLALPTRQMATEHQQVMRPYWIDNELFLLRTVNVNGQSTIQGCWLNWPVLQASMLDSVRDLLPDATLEPVTLRLRKDPHRMLASVPVSLRPGKVPAISANASPVRISVYLAWACVLLAAFAVAVLIHGVLALSQRRASFVSAVSHEMRTPLTTFRMYTEMLTQGMVTDPAKQAHYLQVLHREARRLGHLVDNVLSYSRLDGGRKVECVQVAVGDLLEPIVPRLRERCQQANSTLVMQLDDAQREALVVAEAAGVEQVLFNLVDNACKYAPGTIELSVVLGPKSCAIQIRDHGAGLHPHAVKTLFRPFGKSAQTAAQHGQGVGLGLALSRRYARQIGGTMQLLSTGEDGTCFVLTLKRA